MEDLMSPVVVAYVSGHGFGHAVRVSVVLSELLRRMPRARAIVKTTAPQRLFDWLGNKVEVITSEVDQPPVQEDAFFMDIEATVTAMRAWFDHAEEWLRAEEAWLRLIGPLFVLADISPLALRAAHRVQIPSALIANFTWEWILSNAGIPDPRAGGLIRELASCTSLATWCFTTWPSAGEISHANPIHVGLVGRNCLHERGTVRRRLGIADGEKAVLLSFGGLDAAGVDFEPLSREHDLVFMSTSPRPSLPGSLCPPADIPHSCLVDAADVLVGKLGYCTVAEALIHGTPYLFAPRDHWPEEHVLQEAVERYLPCVRVPWPAFVSGQWGDHLRELASRAKADGQPPYGGDQIACLLSSAFGEYQ